MWKPHLEQIEYPDGTIQKVGWVLVNEAGDRYVSEEHNGAIVTGFTPEEMQELADELNARG